MTHVLIFLTIGLSVFLTPWLRHIPMPVLYGVFLYMGVASLKGLQFFERIMIIFMPVKYQPDYMFLRQVIKKNYLFLFSRMILFICNIMLFILISGTSEESSFIHHHSISLFDCIVAYKIVQGNVNLFSLNGDFKIYICCTVARLIQFSYAYGMLVSVYSS